MDQHHQYWRKYPGQKPEPPDQQVGGDHRGDDQGQQLTPAKRPYNNEKRRALAEKYRDVYIRVPIEEYEAVRRLAQRDGISTNHKICEFVTWGLEAEGVDDGEG